MGRPTKLTPTLQKQLVAALKTGATVVDVCKSVGLGKATFYEWLAIGEAVIDGTKHARMPEDPTEQKRFVDFVDAVTRAQEDAKMSAIKTLRTAMNPYTETTKSTKTFKETRLKRDGTEYQYVRVEESKTTVRRQGDWRAAVEYLTRRHPAEWGDRTDITSGGEPVAIYVNKVPSRPVPAGPAGNEDAPLPGRAEAAFASHASGPGRPGAGDKDAGDRSP